MFDIHFSNFCQLKENGSVFDDLQERLRTKSLFPVNDLENNVPLVEM